MKARSEVRITIAGYGNIGGYVHQVFKDVGDVVIYDPPKQMGSETDLVDTDFVMICVPTAQMESGECDTSIVEEVVRKANPRRAIVCHSTVSIGTTDRLIEEYDKALVFIPEYAGESTDHPYRLVENRDFFVIGGYEPITNHVKELFESRYGSTPEYLLTSPKAAELVKYMENAFLALKVGFCNEYYDLCQAVGVDYDLVRGMWLRDSRINESHTIVTEERGYGGSCFPKDVAAVCDSGRKLGVPLELLEILQVSNAKRRKVTQTETVIV
tara:strand:- start:5098 stop:5907 length:810 start_codon:yes stop_codon:yes gene_type:complete